MAISSRNIEKTLLEGKFYFDEEIQLQRQASIPPKHLRLPVLVDLAYIDTKKRLFTSHFF